MSALTVIISPNSTTTNSSQKPIAPKLKGSSSNNALRNTTNVDNGVSSSTSGRGKRKMHFHPTLGYAIPPPQPAKVARRNARERNRVKQVNGGFDVLKSHIPSAAKHKKLSKVDTLRHAVEYIQSLQRMLTEQHGTEEDKPKESPKSPNSTNEVPPVSVLLPPTTTSSAVSQMQQQPGQYTPPDRVYASPLTPHTPTTPTHEFLQPNFNGAVSSESGYESSCYFQNQPPNSGMISPVNPSLHHQGHYSQHQAMMRDSSSSPTSPSVYSDSSSGMHSYHTRGPPLQPHQHSGIPMSYYENSEEDELLDTIVSWQDQH